MARFSNADLEGVLTLLGEACELEGTEAFPAEFLERLASFLAPAQVTAYAEVDRRQRVHFDASEYTERTEDPEIESRYWDFVAECPTMNFREATGDFAAVRVSDLLATSAWHRLGFYRAYFQPYGFEHVLEVGLPAPSGRHRFVVLFRDESEPVFSERERDLLELLRPHLARMHELAQLRAQLIGTPGAEGDGVLTRREREILDLVADGKTNAEVATALWIAPSTVKKHLENIYEKLGVSGRTAAVTRRLSSG